MKEPSRVKLEPEWINRFLDIDVTREQMIAVLEKLGFTMDGEDVIAPPFRVDIESKADIAEEIARFYGYDKIPTTLVSGAAQGKRTEEQKFERMVNDTMQALGYSEIMTYSFVSPKAYDKILVPADSPPAEKRGHQQSPG